MRSKHILAIGAHPGDMEISCGAVLAAHRAAGNKVTIVHLTDNSPLSQKNAFYQTRIDAEEAALTINADVIFAPHYGSQLKNNDEIKSFINDLIHKTEPTSVITHWKNSIQQDHKTTHKIVCDSILLGESTNITSTYPAYKGIKGLYFTENWEDREDFEPFIYIDITKFMDSWYKMVACYEQFKNGCALNFSYIKYYQELARVRGTESNFSYACTFNLSHYIKKQCLDFLP